MGGGSRRESAGNELTGREKEEDKYFSG